MKKFLFLLVFTGLTIIQAQAVELSKITTTYVEFYNYSTSVFTLVGMHITVNNTVYEVDNLTVVSGSRDVPSGDYIRLSGLNLPADKGSIALWYAGTFPGTPTSGMLASFMQYGAGGQAYESLAVDAALWVSGTYVSGGFPFNRDTDYYTFGANHWAGGGAAVNIDEVSLKEVLTVGPNPFTDALVISSKSNNLTYSYEIYNVIGSSVLSGVAVKQKQIIFNTSLLESGVYFIRVTEDKGKVLTLRLVKN